MPVWLEVLLCYFHNSQIQLVNLNIKFVLPPCRIVVCHLSLERIQSTQIGTLLLHPALVDFLREVPSKDVLIERFG